jgi:hypothetical protein
MKILALPLDPSSLKAPPRYLKLHLEGQSQAASFLKRLSVFQNFARLHPGQNTLEGLSVKNPYPEDWPASAPRPAFADIATDICLLHFIDNSALLATISQNDRLHIHPLVLRTAQIVRWGRVRAPFTWSVVRSNHDAPPVSMIGRAHGSPGGTEISSGRTHDGDNIIPTPRILEFCNELACESRAWIEELKTLWQHSPRACPAPLCELHKIPDKKAKVRIQAWIRDLCMYLQATSPLAGPMSLSIEISPPLQNYSGLAYSITPKWGTFSSNADPRQNTALLEKRLQTIFSHPDCPYHPSKLAQIRAPDIGNIRISGQKNLKFTGVGDSVPSKHRLLEILRRFSSLEI